MDINRKWIVSAIAALAIVWIANIVVYENHILKEPLFMKHYYNLKWGEHFQVYYAQNKTDNLSIARVSFPELGDFPVDFSENRDNNLDRYYNLNTIIIGFNAEHFEKEYSDREVLITKAEIQFKNGKTITEDIGKIYLTSYRRKERILEWSQGGSSNNNTGYTKHNVKEKTIIKRVETKFPEVLRDAAAFKLNGKSLDNLTFPFELKPGDTLETAYSFSFDNKDDIRKLYFYKMSPRIVGETSEGREGFDFTDVHYQPYLRSSDIKRLRNQRRME